MITWPIFAEYVFATRKNFYILHIPVKDTRDRANILFE